MSRPTREVFNPTKVTNEIADLKSANDSNITEHLKFQSDISGLNLSVSKNSDDIASLNGKSDTNLADHVEFNKQIDDLKTQTFNKTEYNEVSIIGGDTNIKTLYSDMGLSITDVHMNPAKPWFKNLYDFYSSDKGKYFSWDGIQGDSSTSLAPYRLFKNFRNGNDKMNDQNLYSSVLYSSLGEFSLDTLSMNSYADLNVYINRKSVQEKITINGFALDKICEKFSSVIYVKDQRSSSAHINLYENNGTRYVTVTACGYIGTIGKSVRLKSVADGIIEDKKAILRAANPDLPPNHIFSDASLNEIYNADEGIFPNSFAKQQMLYPPNIQEPQLYPLSSRDNYLYYHPKGKYIKYLKNEDPMGHLSSSEVFYSFVFFFEIDESTGLVKATDGFWDDPKYVHLLSSDRLIKDQEIPFLTETVEYLPTLDDYYNEQYDESGSMLKSWQIKKEFKSTKLTSTNSYYDRYMQGNLMRTRMPFTNKDGGISVASVYINDGDTSELRLANFFADITPKGTNVCVDEFNSLANEAPVLKVVNDISVNALERQKIVLENPGNPFFASTVDVPPTWYADMDDAAGIINRADLRDQLKPNVYYDWDYILKGIPDFDVFANYPDVNPNVPPGWEYRAPSPYPGSPEDEPWWWPFYQAYYWVGEPGQFGASNLKIEDRIINNVSTKVMTYKGNILHNYQVQNFEQRDLGTGFIEKLAVYNPNTSSWTSENDKFEANTCLALGLDHYISTTDINNQGEAVKIASFGPYYMFTRNHQQKNKKIEQLGINHIENIDLFACRGWDITYDPISNNFATYQRNKVDLTGSCYTVHRDFDYSGLPVPLGGYMPMLSLYTNTDLSNNYSNGNVLLPGGSMTPSLIPDKNTIKTNATYNTNHLYSIDNKVYIFTNILRIIKFSDFINFETYTSYKTFSVNKKLETISKFKGYPIDFPENFKLKATGGIINSNHNSSTNTVYLLFGSYGYPAPLPVAELNGNVGLMTIKNYTNVEIDPNDITFITNNTTNINRYNVEDACINTNGLCAYTGNSYNSTGDEVFGVGTTYKFKDSNNKFTSVISNENIEFFYENNWLGNHVDTIYKWLRSDIRNFYRQTPLSVGLGDQFVDTNGISILAFENIQVNGEMVINTTNNSTTESLRNINTYQDWDKENLSELSTKRLYKQINGKRVLDVDTDNTAILAVSESNIIIGTNCAYQNDQKLASSGEGNIIIGSNVGNLPGVENNIIIGKNLAVSTSSGNSEETISNKLLFGKDETLLLGGDINTGDLITKPRNYSDIVNDFKENNAMTGLKNMTTPGRHGILGIDELGFIELITSNTPETSSATEILTALNNINNNLINLVTDLNANTPLPLPLPNTIIPNEIRLLNVRYVQDYSGYPSESNLFLGSNYLNNYYRLYNNREVDNELTRLSTLAIALLQLGDLYSTGVSGKFDETSYKNFKFSYTNITPLDDNNDAIHIFLTDTYGDVTEATSACIYDKFVIRSILKGYERPEPLVIIPDLFVDIDTFNTETLKYSGYNVKIVDYTGDYVYANKYTNDNKLNLDFSEVVVGPNGVTSGDGVTVEVKYYDPSNVKTLAPSFTDGNSNYILFELHTAITNYNTTGTPWIPPEDGADGKIGENFMVDKAKAFSSIKIFDSSDVEMSSVNIFISNNPALSNEQINNGGGYIYPVESSFLAPNNLSPISSTFSATSKMRWSVNTNPPAYIKDVVNFNPRVMAVDTSSLIPGEIYTAVINIDLEQISYSSLLINKEMESIRIKFTV